MNNSKKTRKALLSALVALALCFSMFVGTTMAWFTDTASTGVNIITSGNLDMVVEYATQKDVVNGQIDESKWKTLDAATPVFDKDAEYEPGYTEVVYFRVVNNGSMALKYQLNTNIISEKAGVNKAGETFKLSEHLKAYQNTGNSPMIFTSRELAQTLDGMAAFWPALAPLTLAEAEAATMSSAKSLSYERALEPTETAYTSMVIFMEETVGNEANHDGATKPEIKLGIELVATQYTYEEDSFDDQYDVDAEYPDVVYADSSEDLAAAITAGATDIVIREPELTTNIKIPGGSDVTISGATSDPEDTVVSGQIATTSSTEGTIVLKNMTIKVDSSIVDSTGISQTGKSAIAIWGNQTVICENVIFDMSLADSTAITSWWDTGVGTSIIVKNCTFNCNGQRPIRATGNVTVENCTFNDPYRYAVQLTAKASTATELEKAIINFKNNTIKNGPNGKAFVYGIQLEGADYGCKDCVINGVGNTIVDGGANSAMYYCECGKVDHATIEWNTEVAAVHENP